MSGGKCWRAPGPVRTVTSSPSAGWELRTHLRSQEGRSTRPIRDGRTGARSDSVLTTRRCRSPSCRNRSRAMRWGSRRVAASALPSSAPVWISRWSMSGDPKGCTQSGGSCSPWGSRSDHEEHSHQPGHYNPIMLKRIYIETYGCQMNVADSELMFGVLGREGYVRAEAPDDADVMLVNTCAVRDNAEQRVIGRVGELQRHKRAGDVLGVVGCMAQRLGPALLARVPKVDLVVGPDAYRNLPLLINLARGGERVTDTEFRSWEHYEDVPAVRENGPTAFVTVQRGCDYRCTFCIVPYTRGPERSRKLAEVVREVAELAERGTTEVTLLGQTVNSYHDGEHDFADLLRAVGVVDGIRRVRFTSPYPTD